MTDFKMFLYISIFLCPIFLFAQPTQNFSPKECKLPTPWTEQVTPKNVLPEYPRPQLIRKHWKNLNGIWQYQKAKEGENPPFGKTLKERILVPFCVEASLSGIKRWDTHMWYRKLLEISSEWTNKRIHLHFGAVDWEAKVYLNGQFLGVHRGGFDGFSFDITDHLKSKQNELIVGVIDTTTSQNAKGKQSSNPGRYSYTPCSGIWQTVWLEPTEENYITDIHMVPDIHSRSLHVTVNTSVDQMVHVYAEVSTKGRQIAKGKGQAGRKFTISIPNPHLWTPDDPFLYDIKICLKKNDEWGDEVTSYFGMRTIELGKVDGIVRPLLNGKFIFNQGTLDQGYWPDGIFTAPTDEALKFDIQKHKDLGFNMCRKHVKVESARWYYWCDKLGLLVWQDMPHRGAFDPDERQTVTDEEYAEILKQNPDQPLKGNAQFERELREMVRENINHPSIIMWVIFNEGWGIYDRDRLTDMVRHIDFNRLVSTQSGGEDKRGFVDTGSGDIRDHHTYGPEPARQVPEPDKTPNPFRMSAVGEYGGIESHVENHLWGPPNRKGVPIEEVTDRYIELQEKLRPYIKKRLSGTAYTQITDVETELNGLLTYDRKVLKADEQKIKEINESMIKEGM